MVLNNLRGRIQARNSQAASLGRDFSIARAMGGSYAGFSNMGTGSGKFAHHAEQLRHNRGYVYAIVRTIAYRIARQKLRVAILDSPREEEYGDRVGLANETPAMRFYKRRRQRIKGVQSSRGIASYYIKTRVPEQFKDSLSNPNAEIIEDHPLIEAFDNPNEIMTGWVMRSVTVGSLEFTGRAYWLMLRPDESSSGQDEIWPLPPSWVEPVHREDKLYSSFKVTPANTGVMFEVPAENIAYFYYPDPADPLGALSPLQAAAHAVVADESIEISNTKTFANGCNPGLALVVGTPNDPDRPELTDDQRNQLIAAVKAHHRGVLNSDEPLILDARITDAKRITTNPREMDFFNSGKATKARLAQMWGVPLTVMGEIENQSRASSAVADEHFLNNVVNPRIEMISQVLTKVATTFWDDGQKLAVYIEQATSTDPELDMRIEDMLVKAGAMSRNELRAAHGREPIKDGDSVFFNGIEIPIVLLDSEEDDEAPMMVDSSPGFMQKRPRLLKDIPGARVLTVDSRRDALPPGGFERGQKSIAVPSSRLLAYTPSIDVKASLGSFIGEGAQVNLWARQLMQMEYQFNHDLTNFFIRAGEMIKTHLTPAIKVYVVASPSMLTEIMHGLKLGESFKETCQPHISKMAATGAMIEWAMNGRKYHPAAFQKGLWDAFSGLPRQIGHKVGEFVKNVFSFDYWGKVLDTVQDTIVGGLEEARTQGDTGRRAAEFAVDKALGSTASATRSKLISETESLTAINGGGNEARTHLAQLGAIRQKKWWTVGDEKVRESHRRAHGQIVPVDAKFVLEDDKGGTFECDFPGDPILPPSLKCRCRCTVISI